MVNTPDYYPEEFLQHVWENRLFTSKNNTQTCGGERLEILKVGVKNTDSGPDFFNAKVKIDDTIWVGNIEIHKQSSDWLKHQHHTDKAYNNIVLHVVEKNDKIIRRANGNIIPALELKIPDQLKQNYLSLLESKTWIPCEQHLPNVNALALQLGFNRLLIERLEEKTRDILTRLSQNKNNWSETFYQVLARNFGMKTNAVPFELLAKSVPLSILAKHKNNPFQIEALLFGNSGLLNNQLLGDTYFLNLRDEYSFLYKKYKLAALESHLWKFLRLRPANFPTIRISQLAALICNSENLFSKIITTDSVSELKKMFKISASDYWSKHYNFNKPSKSIGKKTVGETFVNSLIINVVIPFLFVYGDTQNKEHLKNRALDFLEKLPAENNSIIKKWSERGVTGRSAFDTQALLQLKNNYCKTKKCLNCHIGVKLIKTIPEQHK